MNNRKGWAVTLVGALFFFYAFLQANLMSSLLDAINNHFKIGPKEIGLLSSIYFYANVICIIPAGLLLDRFSIRKLMSVNMMLVILGTLLFAFADNLFIAGLGRFLCGVTMAFGLIICLKLASLCLPSKNMALASSLIVTIGMLGAVVAQTPLAFLVSYYGWRSALLFVAALGIVIMVVLWSVIRQPEEKQQQADANILGSLWKVIKEKQNWTSGLFISLVNLPIAIFGALFGVSFLTAIYKISPMQGASITSMLFWGMIFASPLFGWLSDVMRRRKILMFIGGILCLFFMILALYSNNLGTAGLHILFFLIGFTSASQVIGYPVIAESNPPQTTGTGLSLAAILIMGLGFGIGHPVVGALLDWNLKVAANTPALAYHNTFILVPIGIAIGIVMLLFMKETYCSPIYQKNK